MKKNQIFLQGLEYAPKFVRKFMHIFGFVIPNINGIEEIEIAAKCKEGIAFPLAVITLLGYSAVFEPFLGKHEFYCTKSSKDLLYIRCSNRQWKPTKLCTNE